MKKLITILILVSVMGLIAKAQVNYVPTIVDKTIVVESGDTIYRRVTMHITHWDNLKIQYQFTGNEYRNDTVVSYMKKKRTFNMMMDTTYTFYNPYPNGNTVTGTGAYFVGVVYGGNGINWNLVIELGKNIYFEYIDPNGWFIKPE